MNGINKEHRKFTRIEFDAKTSIHQGSENWPVEMVDISMKGLLVLQPAKWHIDPHGSFEAKIVLSDDAVITMSLKLVHLTEETAGFTCTHIDLDSISLLKRLVELNLAAPDLLHRELSALAGQV